MSIRDIPREQLKLGKTRLRVARLRVATDRQARTGVFVGFSDRIGEVLVAFSGYDEPFSYDVDDVVVAK